MSSSSSSSNASHDVVHSDTGLSTNAVTRSWSNLHAPTWFALMTTNIFCRTLLFHPLELAICRKRVTREDSSVSVVQLLRVALRGGTHARADATLPAYNLSTRGLRGLYRGVGAALTANLIGELSFLYTLEQVKERLEHLTTTRVPCSDEERVRRVVDGRPAALGAMGADLVALLLTTPMVIVANRQMTAAYGMAIDNRYRTMWATWREVWGLHQRPEKSRKDHTSRAWLRWGRDGLRGLYHGTTAGLLRIPSSGCWWALYTVSKATLYSGLGPYLQRMQDASCQARAQQSLSHEASSAAPSVWHRNWLLSATDNPALNGLAAIFASVLTTFLFNPMAVIQTRLQALQTTDWRTSRRTPRTASPPAPPSRWRRVVPFRRVCDVALDIVQQEGLRGFFKGVSANVAVAVLDGVAFSMLFELVKLGSDVQFLAQMHSSDTAAST